MILNNKIKNGFGIVEVMIASVIMMVVIFAMTAAGRSALRGAIYLHERAQAMYIAQEGIEQVRQIRDSNWLDDDAGTTFQEFIDYGVEYTADNTKRWVVSYDGALSNFDVASRAVDESNSIINIDGTEFKRTIIFTRVLSTDSMVPLKGDFNSTAKNQSVVRVTVNVDWLSNGINKNISVSEIITNWRMNY